MIKNDSEHRVGHYHLAIRFLPGNLLCRKIPFRLFFTFLFPKVLKTVSKIGWLQRLPVIFVIISTSFLNVVLKPIRLRQWGKSKSLIPISRLKIFAPPVSFTSSILSFFDWTKLFRRPNIMGKTKGGFYAVARGHIIGVFATWLVWLWELCKAQVHGYPNARYKKFGSKKEAEEFIAANKGPGSGFGGITKKNVTGVNGIGKTASSSFASTVVAASTSAPAPASVFKALTSGAPAWKKNFKNDIHNKIPTRGIATTPSLADFRKKMKVTEDRVVFNMTSTQEDGQISFNAGANLANFTVDEDGFVVVFTDGACQGNGKFGAKAGIGIWFGDGHELNVSEPVNGRQTNNTAEIQAAEVAISQAKKAGINKLCVKTDSQFVINCITKWVDKWRKNGWKLSDGQPVKNKEDLEKLLATMKGVQLKWSYVAGHKGNYGNDQADRLAVEGAKKRVKKN